MWLLSCICLSIVVFSCVFGALFPPYRDNLVQRIGMGILALGCSTRIQYIWTSQHVNNDWFLVHGGMALIAIGAAAKLYVLNRERIRIDKSLELMAVALKYAKDDIAKAPDAVFYTLQRRLTDIREAVSRKNQQL